MRLPPLRPSPRPSPADAGEGGRRPRGIHGPSPASAGEGGAQAPGEGSAARTFQWPR